jgi:hypothetical protein
MDSDLKINSTNFFVNKVDSFLDIIDMNILKTRFPLDSEDSPRGFYRINFAEKKNMGAGTINSNYNRPPVGPIKKGLYCSYCYKKGPQFHTNECPYPEDKSLYLTLGGFNEFVIKNNSYDGDYFELKTKIIDGTITQEELNNELLFIIDEVKLSEQQFSLERHSNLLSKIQFSGIVKKRGPKKLANKTATTQFLNSAIIFYKDGLVKTSIRVSKNGLINLVNIPKELEKLNFLINTLIDKIKQSGAVDTEKFEEITGLPDFEYLPYKSYTHSITAQFSVSRSLEINFENLNSLIAPTDPYGNLLNTEHTILEVTNTGFTIINLKGVKIIEWSFSSGKMSRNQTMIKEYIKFVSIPAPGIKITGIINKYGVIMLTMSRCGDKIIKESLCGDTFTPLSVNYFNLLKEVFIDLFTKNDKFLLKKTLESEIVKPERNTLSGYAPAHCRPIRTRKLKDGTTYYEEMHPVPYSWKGKCPDPNYQFLDPLGSADEEGIRYPCCEAKSKKSIERMKEYLIKGFPNGADSKTKSDNFLSSITENEDPYSGIIIFGSNNKGATAKVLIDGNFETVTVIKKLSKKNNNYQVRNNRTGEILEVRGEDFERESRYFRGLNTFTKNELLMCIKTNLYNLDLKINSRGELVHNLISNLNEKFSPRHRTIFLNLMGSTKIKMRDLTYNSVLDLTKNTYFLKNVGTESNNFFLVLSPEGNFFINENFNVLETDIQEISTDTIILNGFLTFNFIESKYVYTIITLIYYNESLEEYTFIDRELILRELLSKFSGITEIIFVYPDNYTDLIEGSSVIIEANDKNKMVFINSEDFKDNILWSDKDKYSDNIELQILNINYITYTIEFGYEDKEFPSNIGIDLIKKYTFFEKLPVGLKVGDYIKLKINRDINGNIVPNRKLTIIKKTTKTFNYEYIVDLLLVKFFPINYTFYSQADRWYYFDTTLVYDGEKLTFTEDF